MNLEKLFDALGGSYEVIHKLLKKDAMIESFLEDFLADEEYHKLEKAMQEHLDKEAFEACHALKGVALNMNFGDLAKSLSTLTEALRHGRKPEADGLFLAVKADYSNVVGNIRTYLSARE